MSGFSLLSISPLFFIALSALLYTLCWSGAIILLRLLPRMSAKRSKGLLFSAIVLPPVAAIILAVGGIEISSAAGMTMMHHSGLCGDIYHIMMNPSRELPRSLGISILFAIWGTIAWALVSVFRLLRTSFELERGLTPYLQPPSPRLREIVERICVRLNVRNMPFFECEIPMTYSSLIGLHHVRCVLSRELITASTDAELEGIVAHEASHMRAGDVWYSCIVGIMICMFFFLRPVRLLSIRWREEMELACDASAVAATGRPLDMASAILRAQGVPLDTEPRRSTTPAFAEQASSASEMRVRRLLEYAEKSVYPSDNPRNNIWQWSATLLLAALGLLALLSPQALCTAHCSLEIIGHTLH